ncbi:hypothetical protein KFK09_009472 [Dendrobium nobile]|uniref:Uncharacterized protein n=1 Tax=Dendrobium nobile TaxID=94219 RepID=A0A8T3BJH8_DENNO|nr:hypothetical protein KFK09_009472 [Dendrobium nobile]
MMALVTMAARVALHQFVNVISACEVCYVSVAMRIGSHVVGKEVICVVGCGGIMNKLVVGVLVSFMKIMDILFVHGGFIRSSSFKEVKFMFQEDLVSNTGVIAVFWLPLSGSSKDDCLVDWIVQRSLGLSKCSVDGLKWDSISPKLMNFIVLYFEVQGLLIVGFLEVEISDTGADKAKKCLWFYMASESASEFLCQKYVNRSFPSEEEVAIWSLWIEVICFVCYLHFEVRITEFEILLSFQFFSNWEF